MLTWRKVVTNSEKSSSENKNGSKNPVTIKMEVKVITYVSIQCRKVDEPIVK